MENMSAISPDENSFAQTSKLLQQIIDSGPNAMLMVNDTGAITLCNDEVSLLFGYSKKELLGQHVNLLLPAEHHHAHTQTVKNFLQNPSEKRKIGNGRELFGSHKDGRKIPVEMGLSPLNAGGMHSVIATIIDLTARKKIDEENLKAREQYFQASKMVSIGNLTAGVAHEFNNILGAMMGYTELSQHKVVAGKPEEISRYLVEILKSGKRAKELIIQMMKFCRLTDTETTGAVPLSELAILIHEITPVLRASIPKTIVLNVLIECVDLKVHIHPSHLHQILMHLCNNAQDATSKYGRIDISLSEKDIHNRFCSSCSLAAAGDYALITVKDSGSGIPEHILDKIFDPFFTTKSVGKGIGMGLSVVHGLVHGLGGHIVVEPNIDGGTCISILLPLVSPV